MKAWEVLQNGTVVCSYRMGLTRRQALNKIENEHRRDMDSGISSRGSSWSIRQSRYGICPSCDCPKDEDGCGCNPPDA